MPRKKPLPQIELDICTRVRHWRRVLNLPLVYVANKMMQVDSGYLANVEHARTPLQYRFAYPLLTTGCLNPHWLATGQGGIAKRLDVPDPKTLPDERILFSVVYDLQIQSAPASVSFPGGNIGREIARNWLDDQATEWLAEVKESNLDEFVHAICRQAELLLEGKKSHSSEIDARRVRLAELKAFGIARKSALLKSELHDDSKALLSSDVSRLELLLKRIRNATHGHGAKADLARFLGVKPQRVQEWLSDKKSPGGETTLRLLEWVTTEEAKKNTPASADNTRGGEQTRKGNDEKSKTGPPRKR